MAGFSLMCIIHITYSIGVGPPPGGVRLPVPLGTGLAPRTAEVPRAPIGLPMGGDSGPWAHQIGSVFPAGTEEWVFGERPPRRVPVRRRAAQGQRAAGRCEDGVGCQPKSSQRPGGVSRRSPRLLTPRTPHRGSSPTPSARPETEIVWETKPTAGWVGPR